ncbi:MAG: hypothetical protein GF401_14865 [Chitinivibrionales bacterium]|nr:hypothetical protein [Chitinivibrionales bacterium]
MLLNESYDADEILREHEDYEEDFSNEDDVEELDFENRAKDGYAEIVSDVNDAEDLWE